MKALLLLAMAGLFWPAASFAMPMPDCAGELVAANAHVVRVENNGTLVVDRGQRVLLGGSRLGLHEQPGAPGRRR